jgi:hypothetical protein
MRFLGSSPGIGLPHLPHPMRRNRGPKAKVLSLLDVSGCGTWQLPRECGVPPGKCRAGTPAHVLCAVAFASGQTAAKSRPTAPPRRSRCRVGASPALPSSRPSALQPASPCVPGEELCERYEVQTAWTEIPHSGPPQKTDAKRRGVLVRQTPQSARRLTWPRGKREPGVSRTLMAACGGCRCLCADGGSGLEQDLADVLSLQDPAVRCRCFGEGV